jgi:hypothetical protein
MKYRVKVTEKHTDHVWVEADNEIEACDKAIPLAECEFECVYDSEVVGAEE